MSDSQRKNCLIIIPQKHNNKEPIWEDIFKTIKASEINNTKKINVGHCVYDERTMLDTYVFYKETRFYDKVEEQNNLFKILEALNNYFYKNNDQKVINLGSYKNIVLCGHFNCTMQNMRGYWNELEENKLEEEDKAIVANFKDPIMQKGNFIFESYTFGGDKNRLTELVKKIKELELSQTDLTKSETLSSIFSQIFNYCWAGHLKEIILNLVTLLFIFLHSNGQCENFKNIKNSIETLETEHNIINNTFFTKDKLSSVWELKKIAQEDNAGYLKVLQEQKKQVFNALREATETVSVKLAGKVS